MKKFLTTVLILCIITLKYSYSQTDTSRFDQQQYQTKLIIQQQVQQQQQIQQQYENARKRYFGSVNDMFKTRKEAKKEIKIWYQTSLDEIYADPSSNITVEDLDKIRKEKKKIIDSTYYSAIEYLYNRNKYKAIRIFPSFNSYMSMLYYNSDKNFNFFQNTDLSFSGDNASFENEVVSGYIWMIRAGLTTTLSRETQKQIDSESLVGLTNAQVDSLVNVTDSINASNNTLLKIISGGGEANLKFQIPFINVLGNESGILKFKSDLTGQFSVDLPSAGNAIQEKDINFFNMLGITNKLLISFKNFDRKSKEGFETFSLFGKYDLNNVGGTTEFYTTLGIPEKRFWYSEYSVGLAYKNYLIYYSNQLFFIDEFTNNSSARLNVALIKQF